MAAPIPRGFAVPGDEPPRAGQPALLEGLQRLDRELAVVLTHDGPAALFGGRVTLGGPPTPGSLPLLAWVPALTPDRLGDASFQETYGTRVNYVAGAMANGIGSVEIVIAMARAGMIGFFGAAGLPTARIAAAIDAVQAEVGHLPYGFNLIHSPQEPQQEWDTVELYLARGVRTVSAAAYLRLTPQVVRYRTAGIHLGPDGRVVTPNRVLAKVSREEVALHFLRPAPEKMLRELVDRGHLTPEQAKLAERVPMADDLTAEADSGGHTDNRPLSVLLPLLCGLRDRVVAEQGYDRPVRVGAAGGIATPAAVASAFALGAAYVLTGTVNQACVESGTSAMVKQMLAEASLADVEMAPSSDMFEAGVKVQVLKRGTLFAGRARRLYELYRAHDSLEALPADDRERLERTVMRRGLDEIWAECEAFFATRDPAQVERASRDPKHRMALVFRWYLGLSSRWAIAGDEERRTDAQVWCGPAIGAFNDWTRGSFLARPEDRRVVAVAANLMAGAAAITRARALQHQGIDPGPAAFAWTPRPVA